MLSITCGHPVCVSFHLIDTTGTWGNKRQKASARNPQPRHQIIPPSNGVLMMPLSPLCLQVLNNWSALVGSTFIKIKGAWRSRQRGKGLWNPCSLAAWVIPQYWAPRPKTQKGIWSFLFLCCGANVSCVSAAATPCPVVTALLEIVLEQKSMLFILFVVVICSYLLFFFSFSSSFFFFFFF